MRNPNEIIKIDSRYAVRRMIGEYLPWIGYSVTDGLSDKDYLLFSIDIPPGTSISIEDLRMRNHLFATQGTITRNVLSLDLSNGSVIFLLPSMELVPLAKALALMKSAKALSLARVFLDFILSCLARGLEFGNLSIDSCCIVGDSPMILPTAYLLPRQMLEKIALSQASSAEALAPPCKDLQSAAKIIAAFSDHLEGEPARQARSTADSLASIKPDSSTHEYRKALEAATAFAGSTISAERIFPARRFGGPPNASILRNIKRAAMAAKNSARSLVIVRGARGEGKTHLLEYLERILVEEYGYRKGQIAGDREIFQDVPEGDESDFTLVDDHLQDPILNACILDYLIHAMERFSFAAIAVPTDDPTGLAGLILDEFSRRDIEVLSEQLPPISSHDRRRILEATNQESGYDKEFPFALVRLNKIAALFQKESQEGKIAFLDTLNTEERALLTFLSAFKFETPLSFVLAMFTLERESVYETLSRLEARGLVRSRVGSSPLSGGNLSLLLSPSGSSVSSACLENTPREKLQAIHRNIARLIENHPNLPPIFSFYHFSRGGVRDKAAELGYEIIRDFMRLKKFAALTLFKEIYLCEHYENELPKEKCFELLLSLGSYLSNTGNMAAAENFFRRCREEIDACRESSRFRWLALEATRKESEIYEKRGEFLAAEKLLEETLEAHGEEIPAQERAKLYNDLAWIRYRLGDFDRSWDYCLLVHRLVDEKHNPAEIAQSYNLMGTINWNRSRYEDAILCYKKCLGLRENCCDEIGIASTYNNLGLVYRSTGSFSDALECFEKSMEIKKRHENLPGLAAAHLNQALVYLDMGRLKEAQRSADLAAKLAEEIGNQQLLAEACGTMGEIQFLLGNRARAASLYEKDLEICERTGSIREKAIVLRRLGELRLSEGDLEESQRLLEEARALNRKIGSRLEAAMLTLLDGHILAALGKTDDARFKLESASIELSLLGRKNSAATIAAEIGMQHLSDGNEQLSREYLLRAISALGDNESLPPLVKKLKDEIDGRLPFDRSRITSDTERFAALCRLAAQLGSIREREKLEKFVAETALQLAGLERAALIRRGDGSESFKISASAGDFSGSSQITDKLMQAVLSVALRLGYTLDTSKTMMPDGKVPAEYLHERPHIVCIPLRIHGETSAFLYLDSSTRSSIISDEDYNLLAAFCQEAALALERAQLLEKVREMENVRFESHVAPPRIKEKVMFQDIVGVSPSMRRIFELLENMKDLDTTLLLLGSNGTGKDLIARAIHNSGSRSNKPFVSLNCAAIPAELLESELFGHERGAFTGAHRQRIGHFESANGGTIFLNEIGDMPLHLQPKLLHVLEERNFYRVGGCQLISTNVRIIAATNKDLAALVHEGRFREDLYYRINVFPIRIPDLKERIEDIEPLVLRFLATYCRLYGMPIKKISPEAMSRLMAYDWPGNVRELENLVNRLIVSTRRGTILLEDLPDHIAKHAQMVQTETGTTIEKVIDDLIDRIELSPTDPILPRMEGILVNKVVEKIGDKTKAAALLGVSKPTVYAKLKKYSSSSR